MSDTKPTIDALLQMKDDELRREAIKTVMKKESILMEMVAEIAEARSHLKELEFLPAAESLGRVSLLSQALGEWALGQHIDLSDDPSPTETEEKR